MTISVVVVTLGSSTVFARCVSAIASGSRPADELVVVDQSPQGVGEQVESLLADAPTTFRHLRSSGLGTSRARNVGAAATSGASVAFTDDDCVPDPDWLAALSAAQADVATGRVLPLGDERPGFVAVSSRTSTHRLSLRGAGRHVPWDLGTGGNILVKRAVFERVGGFDERFGPGAPFRAAEDVQLLERLLVSGAAMVYAPDAVVYHERKRRSDRLRRRVSYGIGMGAAVASASGPRRRFLASRYLGMQFRALGSGTKALSPGKMAEPVLSTAGFVVGIGLYRSLEIVPKHTVRTP